MSRRNIVDSMADSGGSSGGASRRLTALSGISSTMEEKNSDLLCPICFEMISEAHITKCGHTFCYQCIVKSIESTKRCPKCCFALPTQELIFPNFLLNELVAKQRLRLATNEQLMGDTAVKDANKLKDLIARDSQNLSLSDVDVMLEILSHRRQILETETCVAQNRLLYEFLRHLLKQKEDQKAQIAKEIDLISRDLHEVECVLKERRNLLVASGQEEMPAPVQDVEQTLEQSEGEKQQVPELPGVEEEKPENAGDGFNSFNNDVTSTFTIRKRRMHTYFDDFVNCYFQARGQDLYFSGATGSDDNDNMRLSVSSRRGLDAFRESLVKFSRYSSCKTLATLGYSSDLSNGSIVSGIEFDKDNEYFAIAGVTKRIKVYDYLAVIRDVVDIHYPVVEMVSNSKISCVVWNSYHKNILASSDYDGTVTIWDAVTGQRTKFFQEHDKRCWSVDFNNVDSRLVASGSDDGRMKLWSLLANNSVATLDTKANICCVKFNPKSSCHIAFGSADHCVHYYDLRHTTKPLCVFTGHQKAVSYVKFLNDQEIVSASTDSRLRLWNVNSPPYSIRSYVGHMNEKNFVGLATDGEYIACGSEDISLYVYYKGLPKPLFSMKIDRPSSIDQSGSDLNEFVSAVCWRKQCNVMVVANSRGIVKILELV
ncbi:E3 ubiquitin-protein ligase COP1-like isoform X1 [Phlebotomus argentipes]|uniref:E3 ubiquitin-protein ligase COP1-like isoform X1 n=1 Tax=Phlebotomus argentipes TaxID=94469 RepID=UPI0028936612|nr:E3 ubiquitin-protein ligase COP1-like isoform X1 [Phlebotomus argentipes]